MPHLATVDAWRERAVITLSEAAAVAGRTYSWARDAAVSGRLESHRPEVGPLVVTTSSLRALLNEERAKPTTPRTRRRPRLRLVVSNP